MNPQERVIRKAADLFKQRGIKNVTVDMICQSLGMSKRTMYEVFNDKDELVCCVIEAISVEVKEREMEVLSNSSNVIEAMYLLHKQSFNEMTGINLLFYEDLKKYYPHLITLFLPRANSPESFFYKLITKGQEEGVFRPDINPCIVSEFLQNLIVSLFHSDSVIFEQRQSPYNIQLNILAPYFRGISTELGLKLSSKYENQVLTDLNKIN